jgi:uncharacterized protein (TIGR00252 family)
MPSARSKLDDWGEEAAGDFLQRQGFTILDRKYSCRWGEIDLVARDREDLVFVEVRTRRGAAFGTPEESVTAAKAGGCWPPARTISRNIRRTSPRGISGGALIWYRCGPSGEKSPRSITCEMPWSSEKARTALR